MDKKSVDVSTEHHAPVPVETAAAADMEPLKERSQLTHTARQMFETRIAKYNDPHNLDWDWDDITDKWVRHAFSAFMDLQSVERERDSLRAELTTAKAEVEYWQSHFDAVMEKRDELLANARAEVVDTAIKIVSGGFPRDVNAYMQPVLAELEKLKGEA